jgi:predicted TIM-barrel fold metal-dependent hydrolase
MEPLKIVDPHQHFWRIADRTHPWLDGDERLPAFRYGDYAAICRDYLPDDLRRDAASQNVVMTVHVEAEWDPRDPVAETRWLTQLKERCGLPTAMVGQAWFARPDIAEVLAGHAAFPAVKGVRQKPTAAKSPAEAKRGAPGSMDDPVWRKGYALLERHGLHYDLQTPWWHLDAAADLARDFPRTTIVVNHTGLPVDRSADGLAGWRRALETVAAEPNTALKISGLGLADASWPEVGNRTVVREAIRIFGEDRCMFASNFPVDSLVASYDRLFDGFKDFVADLPRAAQEKLFHDNAVRYYRL